MKGPSFYFQTFPDHEFATGLFSSACIRQINKCKYLIFVKLENISQWNGFLSHQSTINRHRTCKLLGNVKFYGTFQILVLYWYQWCHFHLHLITKTYWRIIKTKIKKIQCSVILNRWTFVFQIFRPENILPIFLTIQNLISQCFNIFCFSRKQCKKA